METRDTLTHVHNSKGFDHTILNVLTTYKS